jgi:hypothetical protein
MFRCLHLLKLQTHSLQMFLELRKPIYPELMSARHANWASCWQTFVSPTLIASSNHKKLVETSQVQRHKFFRRSHDPVYGNKPNHHQLKTCYIIRIGAFHSEWSFCALRSWDEERHRIRHWKGNKCRRRYGFDFLIPSLARCAQRSLHVCGVERAMFVPVPPANVTYAQKNDNSKVKSSDDGPTARKRFQNGSGNFTWGCTLCSSTQEREFCAPHSYASAHRK